ncbi:MAG: UDP-N-acetylenolpyruvoylglucosamine reductase [Gammaproteobacteria bacterium TMED257]|mgnify:FL=1|nr:MAG: UDP-N-acetylenolpyruvoylglucosamine reductase [Gammaproteobacteria bacterium TMED257]|tara:strand:+ start:30 stop:884 length:855 start_codon:yes stop_codon:yes gene_type:complete
MIISKNISLKEFTTIKIGGKAKKIYFPENISDINNLADISKKARTVILGKGSNIAFKDYGYADDIISFKYFDRKGLYLLDNKYISVTAGISCSRLAKFCNKRLIPGFEFLHGIPGTIGGALAMNAGAFKQEIWNHVHSVIFVNKKGKVESLPKKNFVTSYRKVDKSFVAMFIQVNLIINRNIKFDKNLLNSYSEMRVRTQPINQNSSGCIFRNPTKGYSASLLIDKLNIKSKRIGGIYISSKHCNYFINDGSGTCNDLENLIRYVKNRIKKEFNISLKKEICIY